jgi:hypothetical protein
MRIDAIRAAFHAVFCGFAVAISALLASAPARAFTPENGNWWNPAEGGRGFTIEIQDNFLFFQGYLYSSTGAPLWYTAQGTLRGNAAYDGVLTSYRNGQCIGCPFRSPEVQTGAGGNISITFLTETTGRLTWSGGTIPIQRFDYYLTRSSGDNRNDVLRGEWHATLDYSAIAGTSSNFFGDVLVFDRLDTTVNPRQTLGCRTPSSQAGRCLSSYRQASAFFDNATGRHFFVVDNGISGGNDTFAVYSVIVGTNKFEGSAKVCRKTISVSSCLSNTSILATPARGFRTASFSFVSTGSGPNSAGPNPKSAPQAGSSHALPDTGIATAALSNADFANVPAAVIDQIADALR